MRPVGRGRHDQQWRRRGGDRRRRDRDRRGRLSGIAVALAEQAEQNEVLYISGPAAADAVTGVNDYTFRSGRQSLQDVATAGSFLEGEDQSVLVFAQDNAFDQIRGGRRRGRGRPARPVGEVGVALVVPRHGVSGRRGGARPARA